MLAIALLVLAAPAVRAQTQPAATPAADAALAAQKAAFLALPEATRKSAQDALVWLGFYNGVIDGDFGKRTRDAIVAFQTSAKAAADGALTPPELQALLAAAQKARDAAGFKVVVDSKTGAKAGAPTKLLGGRNGAKLEFSASADGDLSGLYARLTAATPSRKIAYKAIKSDVFFVVSGQDGAANFYTRFEKNAAANPPVRGFTFAYPTAQAAQLDRIALAVANSFEAFPEAAKPPVRARRIGRGSAPAQPRACRNRACFRARQGADRAQGGRLPEPHGRRQTGPARADRGGDEARDHRRRFRRQGRNAALRRAGAG